MHNGGMTDYFDKTGKLISEKDWAVLFEDKDYRRIAYTDINDGDTFVSTLWNGHNMGDANQSPPRIFETAVFGVPTAEETWMRWTATEMEAKAMHRAAVAWMRGKAPQPGLTEHDLQRAEQRFREAAAKTEELRENRNRIVKDALASGWTHARIAEATGLTRGRVNQLAK